LVISPTALALLALAPRTVRRKPVEQGAATQVWAATSPDLMGKGGVYCEDCDIAEVAPTAGSRGVRPYAIDPALAETLWKRSEEWTGVRLIDNL